MEALIEAVIEIAKQVPALSIVLFFLYKNNQEWRTYLSERNGKLENALKDIANNCRK